MAGEWSQAGSMPQYGGYGSQIQPNLPQGTLGLGNTGGLQGGANPMYSQIAQYLAQNKGAAQGTQGGASPAQITIKFHDNQHPIWKLISDHLDAMRNQIGGQQGKTTGSPGIPGSSQNPYSGAM